jgi:predicted RNase H-like nuclease (RuvC/YqgF family)
MSQHKEDENVEAFKAKVADLEKRIIELDGENQKLRQVLNEASKTLKVYVDREKEAAIKAIMERADWNKDELDKMELSYLFYIMAKQKKKNKESKLPATRLTI